MNIFKTKEEYTLYVESNQSTHLDSLQPSIDFAIKKYILPITGKELYDDIVAKHHANTLSGIFITLHTLLQKCIANYATHNFIPIAEVQVSDAGITRQDGPTDKTAYKSQVQNLRDTLAERAMMYTEELIEFLETNAATLPLWTDSTQYTAYKSLFVNNGSIFAQYYSAAPYPRQLFMRLRSTIADVEELIIQPLLTTEDYIGIKAARTAYPPSPEVEEESILIKKIQPAIVNLALAKGIPDLLSTIDDNGIHILGALRADDSTMTKRQAADGNQIHNLAQNFHAKATQYLDQARIFLNTTANATSLFVNYYNQNIKEKPIDTTNINECLNGTYSM